MQQQVDSQKRLYALLIAIGTLILAAIACSVDLGNSGEDLTLEQTQIAIELTQIALELQSGDETAEAPPEPSAPTPTITIEPTEAPDVIYEGIQFSFDPALASGVIANTVQGQNLGDDFMPGETYPTHFVFEFNNYLISEHFHTPRIIVYPVAEYQSISSFAADQIANLQSALASKPGGGTMSSLPFLPIWNAGQMFSAQVKYFDFQNGSGMRYLTMYGQAIYPVDNQTLFYTFQGLTSDGTHYVSAVLPMTHPNLPFDGSTQVEDWIAFDENWETYLLDTMRFLGEQPPESYRPSLLLLDDMMASFHIER
jgi:hypothetical protein